MTTNKRTPLALIIAQTIALTACGGGGGSSDDSNTSGGGSTAQTLPPHQIEEGQSKTLTIDGLKTIDASSTAKSNSDLVDVTLSGQSLQVNAAEVDRPASAVITIRNGDAQAIARMSIAINNTSAAALETKATAFVDGQAQMLNLAEARAYYDLETAQAYMDGNIDGGTYQSLKDNWKIGQQSSYQTLEAALISLEKRQTDYEKGKVGEDALADSLQSTDDALISHDQYAGQRFNAASAKDASISFPNAGTLAYYAPSESLSRFVGNRTLGQQTSNGWQFDAGQEKFEFLATFRAKADRYAGEVQ